MHFEMLYRLKHEKTELYNYMYKNILNAELLKYDFKIIYRSLTTWICLSGIRIWCTGEGRILLLQQL